MKMDWELDITEKNVSYKLGQSDVEPLRVYRQHPVTDALADAGILVDGQETPSEIDICNR